jgi:hypothetical protein
VLLRSISKRHIGRRTFIVQSIAFGNKLNLLDQRQGRGGGNIKATSIGGQGRDGIHSLMSEVLQPLSTDVCVEQDGSYSSAQECQQNATLAQSGTTEPVE